MSASGSLTMAQHTCCQFPRRPLTPGLRFRSFSAGKHVLGQHNTRRTQKGQQLLLALVKLPFHWFLFRSCWRCLKQAGVLCDHLSKHKPEYLRSHFCFTSCRASQVINMSVLAGGSLHVTCAQKDKEIKAKAEDTKQFVKGNVAQILGIRGGDQETNIWKIRLQLTKPVTWIPLIWGMKIDAL